MIVYLSILRIHTMVPKRNERFFLEALVTKIIRNIIEFKIIFCFISLATNGHKIAASQREL